VTGTRGEGGRKGGTDGRAPTPGLLADLGVEAWTDHLLSGGGGATRFGGGSRGGEDDWEAADRWRGGGEE